MDNQNNQNNYNYGQPNQQYNNQQYNNQQYNNQQYNNQQFNGQYQQPYNGIPNEFRQEKNVAVCIILSIVTCGIYMWFWMYDMIKKCKMLCGEGDDMVGEYLLLMLVPYYNCYWVYNRGKKISEAAARFGVQASDNSVVYLIMNIMGFQIVSYAMIQDQLNKLGKQI